MNEKHIVTGKWNVSLNWNTNKSKAGYSLKSVQVCTRGIGETVKANITKTHPVNKTKP
jgi:hypothetical protein